MAEWDTRALFTRVTTDARTPRGAQYGTIANLLPVLDRHLRALVVPRLLNVCEDWLSQTTTYTVTSGTAVYRLPSRCLRVLDVALLDSSGRVRTDFSRATPTQAKERRQETWIRATGTPAYWAVDGSSLRLYPTPDASGQFTLTVRYARRPGRLVDSTGDVSWVVEGYNTLTGVVTLNGATAPDAAQVYDIIAGQPGFEALDDDAPISTVVTVAPGIFTAVLTDPMGFDTLTPGDYMSLAGTSPVPQIPLDYITILELAAVEQLCRENGDRAGSESARDARLALMESAQSILEPRADEQVVIVPGYEL